MLLLFFTGLLSVVFAAVTCPPLTPDLPLLQPFSNTTAISDAAANLTRVIASALSAGLVLDNKTTSFILDFHSLKDGGSVYTNSFNAPALRNASEGVSKVEPDTVFRLGSISKVLTVYTFLVNAGDLSWNEPITKYVPELASAAQATAQDSEVRVVRWEDVTIGSLAAQLSGTARASTDDAAADNFYRLATSLPTVPAVNTTFCPPNSTNAQPCNRQAFFQNELLQYPIIAPDYQPIYSNNAYQILAYALETITNSTFETLINATFSTLNLSSSSYLAPASSANSIIPFSDSMAEYSQNVYTLGPGGGMYSTLNDMRTFGLGVLASSHLSPTLTRRWLKPHSFTPDRYLSVGAPWQIHPFPNDHGSANLVIDNLTFPGGDLLKSFAQLEKTTPDNLLVELYYTGLSSPSPLSQNHTIESWRLRPGSKADSPELAAALAALGSITNTCDGWEGLDTLTYGGIGFDEVLITVDQTTQRAVGVEIRVLQEGVWPRLGG